MITLTILGVSILCFALCQTFVSATSGSRSEWYSILKSSKTALPTTEAIWKERFEESGLHETKRFDLSIKMEESRKRHSRWQSTRFLRGAEGQLSL